MSNMSPFQAGEIDTKTRKSQTWWGACQLGSAAAYRVYGSNLGSVVDVALPGLVCPPRSGPCSHVLGVWSASRPQGAAGCWDHLSRPWPGHRLLVILHCPARWGSGSHCSIKQWLVRWQHAFYKFYRISHPNYWAKMVLCLFFYYAF